jgi:hypothetical protein
MTMKTTVALAAMIATVGLARTAGAQQRFAGVEYIAGRTDLAKPFDATLVLDDHELRIEEIVYSKEGRTVRTVFTIPLTEIAEVGASLNTAARNPIPTDGLASTDHREYVTLTMEVGDRIEGVVFRVGPQQSAEIARKIQSAALIAQEPPAAPPTRVRAATKARRRPLHLVHLVTRPGKRQPVQRIRAPRGHARPHGNADRLQVEQA